MNRTRVALAAALLALPVFASNVLGQEKPAPAETPKQAENSTLEMRGNAAFDKNDYATALPLLTQAARQVTDVKRLAAIQEKIRVCQKNLGPQLQAQIAAQNAEIKTSAEERKPHVRPKDGEVFDVAIPQLGNFEYDGEKGGNIPEDVKKLQGVKVRTRGYMIPLDAADNITEFALVSDLFACCFGQPPQVQHTLVVHAPKGKSVSYFPEEIVVEGNLKVDEKKEDGVIISVFEIDCTSVKPAPK